MAAAASNGEFLGTIRGLQVTGFGMSTYCKITQMEFTDGTKNKYTFSFGGGPKKYCVIIAIHGGDYTDAHIDRVERIDGCTQRVPLSSFEEGTVKFTILALHTVVQSCPWIRTFSLQDDSQLYCSGTGSGPALSMAYESLLKYNMTWYQRRFHAYLPGFIRSLDSAVAVTAVAEDHERITYVLDGVETVMEVVRGSEMARYLHSLRALDQPLIPLPLLIDHLPALASYDELYRASVSPRDFLGRLRKNLGKGYCRAVSPWFNRFMNHLHLELFPEHWLISADSCRASPDGFTASSVAPSTINQVLAALPTMRSSGGTRRRHHRRQRGMGIASRSWEGFGVSDE